MLVIYTIGHSNLAIEPFLERLRQHKIEWLVDVRTHPSSQYCPQFNGPLLQASLEAAGIRYRHMGDALGGRPADPELRTPTGVPDYDRIAASERYQAAIAALCALAAEARLAIMCGEGDYRQCHREKLIGRTLRRQGVVVMHILPDGTAVEEPQGSLLEHRRRAASKPSTEPGGDPGVGVPTSTRAPSTRFEDTLHNRAHEEDTEAVRGLLARRGDRRGH
jgi:uncharacterized protein (DUF488 family)